jgi:pimeloyl-ACP methyl ester carboxylesterase
VLYSGGLGSRADANVELGEYLASHGYIVATVPQLGPSDRELGLGGSAGDVALHVRDLEFARNALRTLPEIDSTKLAIIGHSAGGIVAMDFAMRHADVRVVIGLDGSYGFTGGSRNFKTFPDYAPGRIKAAILDLRRANGTQGASLDLSVLEACNLSDRYLVTFTKMFHGDFTEFGTIGLKLSVPLPANNEGRTRQTGYEGNQHAYRAILDFLDAKLRGKPEVIGRLFSEISRSDGARIIHVRAAAAARAY